MDSNYLNMHLTVDRYLRDALTDVEKAAFEERLLWDNELIDEVDLAERLREGLQAAAKEPDGEPARPSLLDWLSSLFMVPQYAAAASFLLAAVLTTAVFVSPIGSDGSSNDAYTAQTEIIPLLVTRSGDSFATIGLPITVAIAQDRGAIIVERAYRPYPGPNSLPCARRRR